MSEEFKNKIKEALEVKNHPNFIEVIDVLKEIVQIVQNKYNFLKIKLEPNYRTNLGREYSIIAIYKSTSLSRYILFKVCIPSNGYPVNLELIGEKPIIQECFTKDDLINKIINYFKEEGAIQLATLNL